MFSLGAGGDPRAALSAFTSKVLDCLDSIRVQ
jgi:hypothetical protein